MCKLINAYTQNTGLSDNPNQIYNLPNTKTKGLGAAQYSYGSVWASSKELIGNTTELDIDSFNGQNTELVVIVIVDILDSTYKTVDSLEIYGNITTNWVEELSVPSGVLVWRDEKQ